jgi:hypothetical protein
LASFRRTRPISFFGVRSNQSLAPAQLAPSLAKSHPGPSSIFINKIDACGLKRSPQCLDGPILELIAAFKSGNSVDSHFGGGGKLSDSPPKSSTSHPALNGQKIHNNALISVAMAVKSIIVSIFRFRNKI